MKVVFAGASHWHYPLYRVPMRGPEECRVVGIMDPDVAAAERLASREGCAAETDLSRLVERTQPDLAIVLGRHSDMPGYARTLIGAGVPFVLEKPGGTSSAELRQIARLAEEAGIYVSIPLVFRSTGFMQVVRDLLRDEWPVYAAFRFLAGLPDRYLESGCGWMLDRRTAGGGVLTNLGIHFLDLLSEILGSDMQLVQAEFARFAGMGDVEDFASVTLRNESAMGRVETGYLYPAPTGIFDMHFSLRTERHYVTALGPGSVEVTTLDGRQSRLEATTTNMEVYPAYVREVVRQVREGAQPIADLWDLIRLMEMLESAYSIGKATVIAEQEARV